MADSTFQSSTPNYTMGHTDDVSSRLSRRYLEKDSAYLLPHPEPGMRIIDVVCGPGSISIGLAAAVAPGEFHGIDMSQSQVDVATSTAQEHGLTNAKFQVADLMELPFPDNHFDVVHCSNVLVHVPDTIAALTEVIRVLKPGGILGAREAVCDSCFIEPDTGNLSKLDRIFSGVLISNGGHPQIGKELKAKLVRAGFADIEPTATVEHFYPPSDPGAPTGFDTFREAFVGTINSEPAIKRGLATPEKFEQWEKLS